jgi:hypothetical protein
VTLLPPPDTTPLPTVRVAAETPSFADASLRSACLAEAAAARVCLPPVWTPWLPTLAPWFGVMFVSCVIIFICPRSRSSSSAAIISSAVGVPWPISTFPSFRLAVLSAWMISHESICVWS